MESDPRREPVRRISISLPESLCQQFEKLVDRRGFRSRSQAIAAMITSSLSEHGEHDGTEATAILTLRYGKPAPRLHHEMAELQRLHRGNITSSSHRLFCEGLTVEVILLQGAPVALTGIADSFITLRSIRSGKLTFV